MEKTRSGLRLVGYFFARMVPMLWRLSKWKFAAILSCRIGMIAIPLLQVYLTARLVNQVTVVIEQGASALSEAYIIIGFQSVLFLLNSVLKAIERIQMFRLQQQAKFHFEGLVAQKAARIPYIYYETTDYYDKLQRASSSPSERCIQMVTGALSVIQNTAILIGYMALLASLHWALAAVLLMIMVPAIWVNSRMGSLRFHLLIHQTPLARKAKYVSGLLWERESAKEIRTFGLTDYLYDRWKDMFWKNAREQIGMEKKATLYWLGVETLENIMNMGSAALLIFMAALGRITVGQFVALLQAVGSSRDLMEQISVYIAQVYEDALFASDFFAFLDFPEEKRQHSSIRSLPAPGNGIMADRLAFSYPNGSGLVLQNIAFHINPGEKVAIVGENGSGKSTLAKCIAGLYDNYEGSLTYDGAEIKDMDAELRRQSISAVYQDFVHYHFTAKENIIIGDPAHKHQETRLKEAASLSGAAAVIHRLKHGYDTQLGPLYDGGQDLSGGQWQKIAIARAYYRESDIMILDEPTAALDPIAEAEVFRHFMRLAEGRTSVMISHRLGSCRHADRILVLKQGQLVESGNHESLMRKGGEYARMFQEQAQWYQEKTGQEDEAMLNAGI